MPGWKDAVANKYDKLPKETWAELPPVPSSYLLRLYTPTLPEGKPGLWGHNVTLPNKTRPIWAPETEGEKCLFCKENEGKSRGDRNKNILDERPFPPRRLGWAIGAVVGIINKGTVQWVDEPRVGLVEKGPEFWGELSRVEELVSIPDELDPSKKILPADWREWLFRVDAGRDGVKVSAVPFVTGHDFPSLTEEELAHWDIILAKRIKPWDNTASLIGKILHKSGFVTSIEDAVEEAYASGDFEDGDPRNEEYVAEYEMLFDLPIKGKDGINPANWPVFIQAWKGKDYGRGNEDPITFRELKLRDRKAIVDSMQRKATEQGIAILPVDDIPF
jgi:hypothetical protein